jgi:hypothetical protein
MGGHVAHMGHEKSIQNFGQKNVKGRDHAEYLGVDGKSKTDLWEMGWEGVDWMQWGPMVGSSDSMKGREFFH